MMCVRLTWILPLGVLLSGLIAAGPIQKTKPLSSKKGYRLVDDLFSEKAKTRAKAKDALIDSGDISLAAALVDAVFFNRHGAQETVAVLEHFFETELGRDYKAWVRLIGIREDIQPKKGYLAFKAKLHGWIDPNLAAFLDDTHPILIRPEEIVWGGVRKDGIPALVNPRFISVEEADYMQNDEMVFGVYLDGQARAYPHRIMDWHEMANDVIGDRPVSLSYCTLCGSGILFDTHISEGEYYVFGSSGFLYRSNKLMYDRQTDSLWSNMTGEPVMGPLAGQGIRLPVLPLVVTTWKAWKDKHPKTGVLSRDTGYGRDYRPGAAYGSYFASPDTMFPSWKTPPAEAGLQKKDWIWIAVLDGVRKAYPLRELVKNPLLIDEIGGQSVALLTDTASEAVRVYRLKDHAVRIEKGVLELQDGTVLNITEEALTTDDGKVRLERVPGHRAYWFSWAAFFPGTTYYRP